MNDDDRISQHLRQQAEGIALTPADPAGAMRRGSRRRTRRRVGLLGSVAAVAVLATSVAVRDPGSDDQTVDLANGTATASTYDWSVVTPEVGLAWGGDAASLADGSVYAISTAPGPYRDGDEAQLQSTLYRSDDGTEWSAASLPDGMRSSDLEGVGDTLYSLGTSPAGGVVLSSSTNGAGSWSSKDLPSEVAELQARHPGKVILGQVEMAIRDASHMVVATTAATNLDLTSYRPEYTGDKYLWEWDDAGVTVYENPQSPCMVSDSMSEEDRAAAEYLEVCRTGQPERGPEVDRFSYEQLGITGELRDHVGGVAYVYATDDGETFRRVELPDVATGDPTSLFGVYMSNPLAVSDGYRLMVPGGDGTTVLRSADGFTWTQDTVLPGSSAMAGVLGGRAAVGTWDENGGSILRIQRDDGTWGSVDLVGAAGGGETNWGVEQVAFGPLGLAALVVSHSEDAEPSYQLVHSTDGTDLQVFRLADDQRSKGSFVSGVTVTADAIAVRISDAFDGDRSTPPGQTVLVGTPTS